MVEADPVVPLPFVEVREGHAGEGDVPLVPIQEALVRPDVAFVFADRFEYSDLSVEAVAVPDLSAVVVVIALMACYSLEALLDA